MFKFAHIGDCHLGAFRDEVLRGLSLESFNKAMDICLSEKVDFILITGDLFHSNIPDMDVVNQAVIKMRELRETGINIYVIYGSHDFSPNQTSVVDILNSAGLYQKIGQGKIVNERLKLESFKDEKTNTVLVGLSGRSLGLEREYYEILDRHSLENIRGFKIFAFHTAFDELKPAQLARMDSIPISYLPKGFDYYAGGHIHVRLERDIPGYAFIRYPGATFGYNFTDLERFAKGEKPGFYIVSFKDEIKGIKFVQTDVCEYLLKEYDMSNKNSVQANEELYEQIKNLEVDKKLVLIRIIGELSGGKTADIHISNLKNVLRQNGAIYADLNRRLLSSREYEGVKVQGKDISEVEHRLLKENIDAMKITVPYLKGKDGVKIAIELLEVLRNEIKSNEKKREYEARIIKDALQTLKLKEVLE
ncbi:MAG: DNA repair exonuclease [Candidatus Bathyarchaeota archaeon]|nr:MAG: DNA repair exonuclease [Candidatus Bathyarchaeota archaeon]